MSYITYGSKFMNEYVCPDIWGPCLWTFLHYSSLHYPDNASPITRLYTQKFITSFPYLLPCTICKENTLRFISKIDMSNVVKTSKQLFAMYVELHNYINSKTGKPSYSLNEAYDMYKTNDKKDHLNPSLWGPPIWFFIHIITYNYPLQPTPDLMDITKVFIESFPYQLPCEVCRTHAIGYITSKTKCVDLAVTTRDELFSFFVEMHNYVNRRTNKREMSIDEATRIYSKFK
jgi:hypothetical protein